MKYLLLLLPFVTLPVNAITWKEFWEPFEQRVYYREPICTEVVYREEYVPGNRWNPGYVRTWRERVRVPCSIYN
jgi:hypothetical protein